MILKIVFLITFLCHCYLNIYFKWNSNFYIYDWWNYYFKIIILKYPKRMNHKLINEPNYFFKAWTFFLHAVGGCALVALWLICLRYFVVLILNFGFSNFWDWIYDVYVNYKIAFSWRDFIFHFFTYYYLFILPWIHVIKWTFNQLKVLP